MKAESGFIVFLRELLESMGKVGVRSMFGGHGVYCDGLFIAIVFEDRLYLKVDAATQSTFRAAGSAPFVYENKGKRIEMGYWSVPDEALDSAEQMQPWARMAMAAALRKPEIAKARKKATKAGANASG